jgi:ribosomal protein L40E
VAGWIRIFLGALILLLDLPFLLGAFLGLAYQHLILGTFLLLFAVFWLLVGGGFLSWGIRAHRRGALLPTILRQQGVIIAQQQEAMRMMTDSGQAVRICPRCQTMAPPKARFCRGCGTGF